MQCLQVVFFLCLVCCWLGLVGVFMFMWVWLVEYLSICLGVDIFWLLFEYCDEQGCYQGFVVGYIGLLQECLGVSLMFVELKIWMQVLEQVKDGWLNLLFGIMVILECQEYLSFIWFYLDFLIIILVCKNGLMLKCIDEFYGFKVVVVDYYVFYELLIVQYFDFILLLLFLVVVVLQVLVIGQVDVFVGDFVFSVWNFCQFKFNGLEISGEMLYCY